MNGLEGLVLRKEEGMFPEIVGKDLETANAAIVAARSGRGKGSGDADLIAAGAALVLTPALSTLLRNGVLLFDSCAAGHLAPKPTCLALALRAAGHGLGKAEEQRLEKVEHLRRELLDRGI